MAITTTKNYYDSLDNDNVKFLQGKQVDLNKFLVGGTKAGQAEEGAFYLTTDTHRLYIGRKAITPESGSLPTGMIAGKVYPEEVSTGIATVQDTGSLPTAAAEAHDGDFYYIQNDNILAVYKAGQWVQINAATEITGFTQSTTNATGNSDTVLINTSVTTPAGTKASAVGLVAGNTNVTLTPGTKTVGESSVPTISISTKDTKYTAATAAQSGNGAKLGLKKDSGSTLDSQVTITGTNGIGVTSTNAGAISVNGPSFTDKGVKATAIAAGGFKFDLQYDSGIPSEGTQTFTHSTYSTLDPTITYGSSTAYTVTTTAPSAPAAVHFLDGNATLDVYSKAQADYAITTAINNKLATANAMTYKGSIKSESNTGTTATATIKTVSGNVTIVDSDNNAIELHNGDTYKAAADFTYNPYKVKTGDLIIFSGTEDASGVITGAFSIDVIPSGDEPYIGPLFTGNNGTGTTILNLVDQKNSNSLVAGLQLSSSDKIKVSSTITNNNTATLSIEHKTQSVTRTDNNGFNTSVDTSLAGGKDSIDDDAISLFILNNKNGIVTDNYGHITEINGKQITFEHNKLKSVSVGYSNQTLAANSTLKSKAYANVSVSDAYLTQSKSIAFESTTLSIASNGESDAANQALSIDLKWGSF